MQVVYERCCDIDVHKKIIVINLRVGRKSETREFGTYTRHLREMAAWPKESDCQMVAMESTGSYWKPLLNIFELEGLNAIVLNAQHMKAVPGRKTDVKDAEWIADLLQHGLLRASYIPDKEQRDLRDLLRYRKSKVEERARELNRLQKFLEGANIKLDGTISDIGGVTGKKLLSLVVSDRAIDLECANAVVTSKKHPEIRNRYLAIKKRGGHKKAIIAIARMLLTAICHMIKNGELYTPELYNKVPSIPSLRDIPLEAALKIVEKHHQHGVPPVGIALNC